MKSSLIAVAGIVFIVVVLSGCTSALYSMGIADCGPVYGNWCGENYPLEGYDPDPVDDWDRACRSHDRCYDRGNSKEFCDRELINELEYLSRRRLTPQVMYNAYEWFRKDGRVVGWTKFSDESWALCADCEGGDGRAAEFYCMINYYSSCPLNPNMGPGRAGMPCHCGPYFGVIIER